MKSFQLPFFFVTDLRVGDTNAQLDKLNVMDLIGPQSSRGQLAALNHERQGDCSYLNEQDRQSNFQNGLTYNGRHRQSYFSGSMTHNSASC